MSQLKVYKIFIKINFPFSEMYTSGSFNSIIRNCYEVKLFIQCRLRNVYLYKFTCNFHIRNKNKNFCLNQRTAAKNLQTTSI